jgi:hypothetical protein
MADCRTCLGAIEDLAPGEWWCPACKHVTTRRGNPGRWLRPGVAGRFRRELAQRRRPLSFSARLRMYRNSVAHVLSEISERCQDCGRGYPAWHADDGLYREAHGSPYGTLCPACFARQAEAAGIIVVFAAQVLRRAA